MMLLCILLLLTFGLIISPVLASCSCITANPGVLTSSNCYYIVQPGYYECSSKLNTSCFYDLIVSNTNNVVINCSFNRMLIWNSSNVKVVGNIIYPNNGTVVIWNSTNVSISNVDFEGYVSSLFIKNSYICQNYVNHNKNNETSFIVCVQPSLVAKIIYSLKAPQGVLIPFVIAIKANKTTKVEDVIVEAKPLCHADIWIGKATKPIIGTGNKAIVPILYPNDYIFITYYGRIYDKDKCPIFIKIYSSQKSYNTTENIKILSNTTVYFKSEGIKVNENVTPLLVLLPIFLIIVKFFSIT